jgi:hypothetical protein
MPAAGHTPAPTDDGVIVRRASLIVLISACGGPSASSGVVPLPGVAPRPAAAASTSASPQTSAKDIDVEMARGWSLVTAGRLEEGVAHLREVVAAASSTLPRASMCGREDAWLERSGDVFWATAPRGVFFFDTKRAPVAYAPVSAARPRVLAPTRLIVSETQERGDAPHVHVVDWSGTARFDVPGATLLGASPTGGLILLERWGEPHTVEAWDPVRGGRVQKLSLGPEDGVQGAAPTIAPGEGSVVLPLSRPKEPFVWALFDLVTGRERGAWVQPLAVSGPEFSPDGRLLAVVDDEASTTRLVDAATGRTVARSSGCPRPRNAGFTTDGRLLAVTGRAEACLFGVPDLRLRWRARLQSEQDWQSVDYHNDLSVAGFVGEGAAVVIEDAHDRVAVLDVASGRKVFDGCGRYTAEAEAITCDGPGAVVTFDRRAAPIRRAVSADEARAGIPELGLASPRGLCGLAEEAACRVGGWIVPAAACR